MNGKKWVITFLSILIILGLLTPIVIYIVDPYFHYRMPKNFFGYNLENERYINNGILKNFDYDAIITGTSLAENFKTSEFNELFQCNSVKVPLAGAQFKELAEQMEVAIQHNNKLNLILYEITYEDLLSDKNDTSYDEYPTYLYDEDKFNDYKYLFSGQALIKIFKDFGLSLIGKTKNNFDTYANWNNNYTFSKNVILSRYKRHEEKMDNLSLTEEEKNMVMESIEQNITSIVKENKDKTFLIFLSPNSIVWWDNSLREGKLEKYLEAEEILIKSLLEFDNVKLYSFFNNYDLTCNYNNYRDTKHYSQDVNSQILQWIKEDKYLLTKENVEEYLDKEKEFYSNYDYDSIFED